MLTNPIIGSKYEWLVRLLRRQGLSYMQIGKKLKSLGFKANTKDGNLKRVIYSYFKQVPIEMPIDVDSDAELNSKLSGIEDLEELINKLYFRLSMLEDEREEASGADKLKYDKIMNEISEKIKGIRKMMIDMYKDEEIKKMVTMILKEVNKELFRILRENLGLKKRRLIINGLKEAYIKINEKYNLK